jgi:hypothetical protein
MLYRLDSASANFVSLNVSHNGLQVLTLASMKMSVFWNVSPSSLIQIDRRFRDDYSLHHQVIV